MSKKYTIKDIALLAGVSAGTVDRVIHNRGDVSSESRQKVEKVLNEIKYLDKQPPYIPENSKPIRLLMILPQSSGGGDYWSLIERGMNESIRDFSSPKLKVKFMYYDQFDLYSCRNVFKEAIELKSDGVIIGPSFYDETVFFANQLFMKDIPYIFVDTSVNNTKPLAFFGPHSFQTGVVQARLLTTVLDAGKDITVFQAKRIGDETSIQSLTRMYGFMSYIKEYFPDIKVLSAMYDYADKAQCWNFLDKFFEENPNVGGAVVFNTRGYIISEYLRAHQLGRVKLIGYGTDKKNVEGLKDGYISFIISERPYYQGYRSIRTMLEYLLYDKSTEVDNYTPIDILIKETVDFYMV